MSETAIFIIGAIVFAITVYGAVMAAGVALTRVEIEQNSNLEVNTDEESDQAGSKKRFRFWLDY